MCRVMRAGPDAPIGSLPHRSTAVSARGGVTRPLTPPVRKRQLQRPTFSSHAKAGLRMDEIRSRPRDDRRLASDALQRLRGPKVFVCKGIRQNSWTLRREVPLFFGR